MATDKVFHFGKNRSLIGIISDPVKTDRKIEPVAVVILNSGLLHRIGPNRIYVKIARALAEAGITAMRFDFSGVGDSEKQHENLLFEESSVLEAREAMNFLETARGIKRFYLTGICSGADVAFQAARVDERVAGIIPIDFYSLPTAGYLVHSYKKRLISPRSWANLMTGKSEILGLMKKSLNNLPLLKTPDEPEEIDDASRPEIEKDLLSGFPELLDRDVRLCMIYSAGSPAFYNYQLIFENDIQTLSVNGELQIHYLETADHGFTLLYHQEILINLIREWVLETCAESSL